MFYFPQKYISIGFDVTVNAGRIVMIFRPHSKGTKAILEQAKKEGRFVDATYGRSLRSAIALDNGQLIGSAVSPPVLFERLNTDNNPYIAYDKNLYRGGRIGDPSEEFLESAVVDLGDDDDRKGVGFRIKMDKTKTGKPPESKTNKRKEKKGENIPKQ